MLCGAFSPGERPVLCRAFTPGGRPVLCGVFSPGGCPALCGVARGLQACSIAHPSVQPACLQARPASSGDLVEADSPGGGTEVLSDQLVCC